jgi:hypothetical protein
MIPVPNLSPKEEIEINKLIVNLRKFLLNLSPEGCKMLVDKITTETELVKVLRDAIKEKERDKSTETDKTNETIWQRLAKELDNQRKA